MQNRAKPCKLFHVSCKKSCSCHAKKRASCSTYHAKTQAVPRVKKHKLFHMQKPCKKQAVRVMQKKLFHVEKKQAVPHAKTVQNRAKNQHVKMTCLYVHAKTMQKPCKMRRVRSANPPNIHSPRVPCYMCYMCYISQGKPLNITLPGFLAICAICAVSYKASH